jgi:hypothetical protein
MRGPTRTQVQNVQSLIVILVAVRVREFALIQLGQGLHRSFVHVLDKAWFPIEFRILGIVQSIEIDRDRTLKGFRISSGSNKIGIVKDTNRTSKE